MKAKLSISFLLLVAGCSAPGKRTTETVQETSPGVEVPSRDSARYKMPVVKDSSVDTSMAMPVVPPKNGVVPK
jgi:PBP1b-binding outer membrane lipoprotein LpoB